VKLLQKQDYDNQGFLWWSQSCRL